MRAGADRQESRQKRRSVRRSASRRRGITLVEVLVGSILLGIGVTGLISSAALAMRNQRRSEHRAAAMYLAQEVLANVDATGAHTWALGYPSTGTESRPDMELSWTVQIEQTAVAELYRVLVKVDWAAASGPGSVGMETLLNDYEAASLTPANQRKSPSSPQPDGTGPRG